MRALQRSGESGKVSKGLLVVLGVLIVIVLGGVVIAGVAGYYFYTHKEPDKPKTIQPAATNANNIAPTKK